MELKDIESVSFSKGGFPTHVKSPIIWGNRGNEGFPLCYLMKPKWMPETMWKEFLDSFDFSVKKSVGA